MKKVLFFLIVLLTMITTVKAGDLLEYDLDWESNNTNAPVANSFEYKDGYLFGDYNFNLSYTISRYDRNGNFIKEITIDDYVMALFPDEYFYILSERYQNNSGSMIVQAYNEDLELINEVVVFTIEGIDSSINEDPEDILEELVKNKYSESYKKLITKDYILIPTMSEDANQNDRLVFRKYKKDLSSYETLNQEQSEQLIEDIGVSTSKLRREFNLLEADNIELYTQKGDITAFIIYNEGYSLKVFDKKNLLYSNPLGESLDAFRPEEVVIVDNHVMIIYNYPLEEDGNWGSVLAIYNIKTGKLEKEVNSTKSLFNVLDTKKGFLYHETSCDYYLPHFTKTNPTSYLPTFINHQLCATKRYVYSNYNFVTPKVTAGKGEIIVEEKQSPDDQVTFTIKPAKGYVLGKVKVTDSDGNVLVFTNNTFTMPHADVTIEVEFLVANANTGDITIVTVALLFILSFIVIMVQKRKIKELKVK